MHEKLEAYLAEVATGLQPLPPAVRETELAEMRQHLLALVESGLLLGESEDEAVTAAIQRFGNARAVGRRLRQVWRRGQVGALWSQWGLPSVRGAVRGALTGVLCGACSAIFVGASFGIINGGFWSALECLAAFSLQAALFMALVPGSGLQRGRRSLGAAATGGLVGLVWVAAGCLGGLFSGVPNLMATLLDTMAVLISRVACFQDAVSGRTLFASYQMLLLAVFCSGLGAFWESWSTRLSRRVA